MIDIIPYSPEYKEHIKRLNTEWLEKHFRLEEGDVLSLGNPQEYILDKGGYIFYARLDGEIAGTASLLKKTDTVFELGKMAVDGRIQGKGIGTMLLAHCIDFARQKGSEKLILYSNTRLEAAIYLYRTYGFKEIPLEEGLYDRANIKMELVL